MKQNKDSVRGSPDTPGDSEKTICWLFRVRKDSRTQPKLTLKTVSQREQKGKAHKGEREC